MVALGGARLTAAIPHFGESDLATYNGTGFVTLEGVITDAPDVRDTTINLRVKVETVTLPNGETRPIQGLVLVQTPRTQTYRYGDAIRSRGELTAPPELEEFSYRDYLAREGVYSLMRYSNVTVVGPRRGNSIRVALLDFRAYAHQTILRLLPDPQASLLAGILLGIESGIAPEVREAFNATGTTHVIAISGANLAILAGLVSSVARRFLSERATAGVTIAAVLVYAMFVGGDAAVLRAAIMTTLGLVAAQLGRQTYGLASLSFAALLLTAINPLTLWDVGFQLSFLATLGLILYVEPMQRWLGSTFERFATAEAARKTIGALSDSLLVTIAAQIATAPIMAYHFGRFSPISLPVNLLIVPVQAPLMALGGLGVLLAMVIWPIGQVVTWGSWLFLSYTLAVVRAGVRLPWASLDVHMTGAAVFALYVALFGTSWLAIQPQSDRARWGEALRQTFSTKIVALAGLLIAALLIAAAWSMPDRRLHVTFIEAGQGSAALIETPSGRHILIDAGSSSRALSAALGDALPFWDRRLDLVVLTQPTQTHIGGLPPILERYRIDAVMTNGTHGDSEVSGALWASIQQRGIPEVVAVPGTRVTVEDGVTITVLHTQVAPLADTSDPGEPVVLMVSYGDARILLAGDLSAEGEAMLLRSGQPLDATVLHVPRAGQGDAAGEPFLAAVDPQVSILTGIEERAPDAEVLARIEAEGSVVYRTDLSRDIELVTDGESLQIFTSQ
jgi:competence protein ComEC